MSNDKANITGSMAREHEATGGNAKAGQNNLPQAGSAAEAAESEKKANAHGTGSEPRSRGTEFMRLPQVRGARLVEAEPPKPDLSQRKAADYLPAHLKAQLIAEGKLTASGELVQGTPRPPTPPIPEPTPAVATADGVEPTSWVGSLVRRLRNLFS